MLRNQKGFTLIEIIAVLVILGILAAVAIPKYLDLQQEARIKSIKNGVAALQSTATHTYAQALLNGNSNGTNWGNTSGNTQVGDFYGTFTITATTGVSSANVTGTLLPGYDTGLFTATNAGQSWNMW